MLLSYLESILYSHLDYDTISSNTQCQHVDGGFLNSCYCTESTCPASCQSACSSYSWCVGYSERTKWFDLGKCLLHFSSPFCPSGWFREEGKLANTASQLIASPGRHWICMGKLGKVSK